MWVDGLHVKVDLAGLPLFADFGADPDTIVSPRHSTPVAHGLMLGAVPTEGPILWNKYLLENIPALFGINFSEAIWHAGFVRSNCHLFLLVTLEKGDLPEGHNYEDNFLSSDRFQWKSQKSTT